MTMSKRGRSWANKLKKLNARNKLRGLKDSFAVKKKATAEQLGKLKRGASSYTDIIIKKDEFEKLYKETGEEIYKDKVERIDVIIKLLKKMNINEAKKLALEYEALYPNDF